MIAIVPLIIIFLVAFAGARLARSLPPAHTVPVTPEYPHSEDFSCITTMGSASIETLRVEAPETLRQPHPRQFLWNAEAYQCALDKFNKYGRWDTDAWAY